MTESLFGSVQGDPATVDDANLDCLKPLMPKRLFSLWETHQWAVATLDFERDRQDWLSLREEQREMLVQSMAPFFAGEARVAAVLAPIILAADDDQEMAFLATQQADEARHMLFFERFWREVTMAEEDMRPALDVARARCNDAFFELFERRPLRAVEGLRANPRDMEAKVEAVTVYHLIVEAMLGLTAMHFVLDYFEKNGIFPATAEGMHHVKRDEHRHVAWGTWFLRQKCREDVRYAQIVERTLMELLPVAASVFVKGGVAVCDGLDPCEFLGYPSAQLNYFAFIGLSRRLKVIGGATSEVQGFAASGAWRAARVL